MSESKEYAIKIENLTHKYEKGDIQELWFNSINKN